MGGLGYCAKDQWVMDGRDIIPVVGSGEQNGMPDMGKVVNHMVLKWGESGQASGWVYIIKLAFMTFNSITNYCNNAGHL